MNEADLNNDKFIRDKLNEIKTPKINQTKLKNDVLDRLNESEVKNGGIFKLRLATAICASLIVVMTTAVLANYDKIMEIINRLAPNYSDYMEIPLNAEYSYEGIILKIESVSKTDNMARIIYSIKDEQNRFDENLGFNDYISVKGANSAGGPIRGIHDKESGKIYRIINASSDTGFESGQVELRISKMFYNEQVSEGVEFDIDLFNMKTPNIIPNKNEIFKGIDHLTFDILEVDGFNYKLPIYGDVWISNIGVLDNRLHIQIKSPSKPSDEHYTGPQGICQPFLDDKNGERIPNGYFRFSESESGKISYFDDDGQREFYIDEYVFDLGENKIEDLSLRFHVRTWDIISGDWRVSCETKDIFEKLYIDLKMMTVGSIQIEDITINPFSVTLNAYADDDSIFTLDSAFDIIYTDGYIIHFDSFSSTSYDEETGQINATIFSESEPIILDKIQSININGLEVYKRD